MKMRNGFVTNSSSSSFLAMKLKSNKLAEILEICKLYDGYNYVISEMEVDEDGVINYREDESAWYECPENLRDVLNFIIMLLTGDPDSLNIEEDEAKNIEFDIDKYEKKNSELEHNIAAAIFRNRNEILADIEMVEIECSECGYGGDDDTRFYKESYSEETLQSIYEAIAGDLDKSVEEVTDEEFNDYVGNKTSVSESRLKFSRMNGEEHLEIESDYYLE